MRLLLDTNILIWQITGGGRLSAIAKDAILNESNQLYLSAAAYWEICIKVNIGKLQLKADWQKAIEQEMVYNNIIWLPIERVHCQQLVALSLHHRDPFDRIMISQAMVEEMTVVSADSQLKKYPIKLLW